MSRQLIVGLALSGVLLISATAWLLSGSPCANELLSELPSPDGTLKAVVFQRDCGATTGFSTQVSIISGDQSLGSGAANLFVADDDHGKVPAGVGGGPEVQVAWTSARSVRIARDREARVFLAKPAIAGISVEYIDLQ